MTIGATSAFASTGLSSTPLRSAPVSNRPPLIFEAKPNPQAPHEFTAQLTTDTAAALDRQEANKARDPASRAFLTVASFQPVKHQIDIYI